MYDSLNIWRTALSPEKHCVYLCVRVFVGCGVGGHGKLRTTSLYWCLEEKPY